jgi:hypothetical protein
MVNQAQNEPSEPVVVTFREVRKILTGQEAVEAIPEAANADPDATPVQRAAAAAAMGQVLRQLEKADRDGEGALVFTGAQDGPASRLQSLIASGEKANLTLEPLAAGGLEAKFDTGDWLGWAQVAWAKLKHLVPHPMKRPTSTTPDPLPNAARIAIVGDWGTGLYGAPKIANAIRTDSDPFAVLMHLGDVYYSGTSREMRDRFLNVWPTRQGAVSRGLNSNHDMYSGGEPYFKETLPAFNQPSSYFAFQNQHFTLIGLDVAYIDHDIDDQQAKWVEDVIAQAGTRKVIFFSHHQLYSHFEGQGAKLWQQPRFGAILRRKRVFAWYWGHEHRCSIFQSPDVNFGILGRCIGHGGMPQNRNATRNLPAATHPDFSRAEWKRSASVTKEGNILADCVVLDGRNPLIPGEEDKFTPHGYAVLTLDGPHLKEEVRDPLGNVIYDRVLI